MTLILMDYETFSCTDIRAGGYRYVEDPMFEALMVGYSENGAPAKAIIGERRVTEWFGDMWHTDGTIFVAHNANFERLVSGVLLGLPVGTYLDPERFIDTAAIAAGWGLPRDLKRLAKALGAEEKDEAGTRLINLFSKPNRGKRIMPSDKPEQWLEFRDYCVQDVDTLVDVYRRLPSGWSLPSEETLWYVDQRINDRGIVVDLDLARAAVAAGEKLKVELMQQAKDLTGLANPNSTQQLHGWLEEQGAPLENLQAETVKMALLGDLPEIVRTVLEIRQETSLSALKKFDAALRCTNSDGRLRGAFRYLGAHTGRWSGSGVQTQNLPRLAISLSEEDEIRLDLCESKAEREALEAELRAAETERVITHLKESA